MKRWLTGAIAVSLVTVIGWGGSCVVEAQSSSENPVPQWLPAAESQADSIPVLISGLLGQVPATIPQSVISPNLTGKLTSYQPGGSTTTAENAFFATGLGGSTNGRTCFTCHQPQDGWALKPSTAMENYLTTAGKSPLFQPVDGANCPSLITANQTVAQFLASHSQMLKKANTRIFLPEPASHEWATVTALNDPTTCENNATYGLNATPPMASFYRRPLPTANIFFQDPQGPFPFIPSVNGTAFSIMWDSREASLESQFNDAVKIHAQAPGPPEGSQVTEGINFQDGIFAAQSFDTKAGDLTGSDGSGATGGPVDLSGDPQPGPFPKLPPGLTITFDLYDVPEFTDPPPHDSTSAQRASIARGEAIFDGTGPINPVTSLPKGIFTLNAVAGLNDVLLSGNPQPGSTCAACHNNVNAGNDVFLAIFHTGVGDNSSVSPEQSTATVLQPTPDMPLFQFLCPQGSIPFFTNPVTVGSTTYDAFETEDPGYGWISGKCSDLGKFKVPVLRGLAARAPYFHGGQAQTLTDLVNFYNTRFSIGLNAQDQQDLVNFLNTL